MEEYDINVYLSNHYPLSHSPRRQLGRVSVPVVVRQPARPRRDAGQHVPEAHPEGRRQEGVQDRVDAGVAVGQDVRGDLRVCGIYFMSILGYSEDRLESFGSGGYRGTGI